MSTSTAKRPESVPPNAVYEDASKTWRLGSANDGRLQIWHPCGLPIFDAHFEGGTLHGPLRFKVIGAFPDYGTNHHDFCMGLMKQFGLPDGDDLSELRAEYTDGHLATAKFVLFMDQEHEREKLSATFQGGQLERLRWQVSGSSTVFSHGGLVIERSAMKIPKPWPASVEVGVAKGKVSSRRYFDKDGKEMVPSVPAAKVPEWGQHTELKELDGYITSGRFLQDVTTFFRGAKPDQVDPDASRAKKAFARLPKGQQPAALLFDEIVKKDFPSLTRSSLSGYGFDCVKNELHAATDDKYFGLSYTSDGDLQLLDLESGRVLEWVHDYEPFEEDAAFPSLDAYAFALVRIELAAQKRIPKSEAKAAFERLGFGWCAKLI